MLDKIDPNDVPWSVSGELWPNDPTPVGVYPDGTLLVARGDRHEYRYLTDAEGTIWIERRIKDTNTAPYRAVCRKYPWELKRFWFKRQIGELPDGSPIYGKVCKERRRASGLVTMVQRHPIDAPGYVYEFQIFDGD